MTEPAPPVEPINPENNHLPNEPIVNNRPRPNANAGNANQQQQQQQQPVNFFLFSLKNLKQFK
jgi:hypothetical protein